MASLKVRASIFGSTHGRANLSLARLANLKASAGTSVKFRAPPPQSPLNTFVRSARVLRQIQFAARASARDEDTAAENNAAFSCLSGSARRDQRQSFRGRRRRRRGSSSSLSELWRRNWARFNCLFCGASVFCLLCE